MLGQNAPNSTRAGDAGLEGACEGAVLPSRGSITGWRNGLTGLRGVRQREGPAPAAGEEPPQAPGQAGGQQYEKQLCRKSPGGAERASDVLCHSKGQQQHRVLHQEAVSRLKEAIQRAGTALRLQRAGRNPISMYKLR